MDALLVECTVWDRLVRHLDLPMNVAVGERREVLRAVVRRVVVAADPARVRVAFTASSTGPVSRLAGGRVTAVSAVPVRAPSS